MASEPMRKTRERDLVVATRALWDDRGVRDAPVEEIAQAVGIARGLIYRHFSSKDELYVLTVTDYLDELAAALSEAVATASDPVARLEACAGAYARFCQRYPAFLDSALALMHGPARELHDRVNASVWLRLGQGMATCVGQLASILHEGAGAGLFAVEDPDYLANVLWTSTLGTMHLARIRVAIRPGPAGGLPELFTVDADRVVATCVEQSLRAVGL